MPIPKHRADAKAYLRYVYGAATSEGCEADDLMGIEQCRSQNTVIASLDKDLLMIPGRHFSWEIRGRSKETAWVKPAIHREVSYIDGLRHFYKQCIVGDVADNVKGIPRRGEKYANALLDGLESEREMFDAVRNAYGFDDAFLMNARCLWIWQKEDDDFIERFKLLSEDE